MGKLSHALIDLGFFSALGTLEYFDGRVSDSHVERGEPNTWDSNNGVTVIYDEVGRPWIVRNEVPEDIKRGISSLIRTCGLKVGGYVPHSNDGGRFVIEVMEKL